MDKSSEDTLVRIILMDLNLVTIDSVLFQVNSLSWWLALSWFKYQDIETIISFDLRVYFCYFIFLFNS